jgi:hypothetical protein
LPGVYELFEIMRVETEHDGVHGCVIMKGSAFL